MQYRHFSPTKKNIEFSGQHTDCNISVKSDGNKTLPAFTPGYFFLCIGRGRKKKITNAPCAKTTRVATFSPTSTSHKIMFNGRYRPENENKEKKRQRVGEKQNLRRRMPPTYLTRNEFPMDLHYFFRTGVNAGPA